MARQRLLGEIARARLLGLPADEREIVRHATLRSEDLTLIAQRRGGANQLGFALMLVCLRHPARVLEANEMPPAALLSYLAQQLDVDAAVFTVYARRDQTRRTHLVELTRRLGLFGFDRAAFHTMVDWALSIAPSMRDPEAIAVALVEELRRRHILLPSLATLELMVRTAQRRAEAVVQHALTQGLSEQTRVALERLVASGPEAATSRLAWLRTASRSPAARNLHGLIERLHFVRGLGVPRTLQSAVPQVAFQRLVAEATRMTAQRLAEATASRRLALLVTVTLHLETALTDAVLSMFDKLMGSLSRRAERRSEEQAARSVGDLRMRLRLLAGGCRALIAARDANDDLEEAIELYMGWSRFIRVVNEAEAAAGPEVPDTKAKLLSRYSTIRQFAPALLDAFQFRGGRTLAGLLRAIEIVRELNHAGQRSLPAQVPTGFIRRAWRPPGVAPRRGRSPRLRSLCPMRASRQATCWRRLGRGLARLPGLRGYTHAPPELRSDEGRWASVPRSCHRWRRPPGKLAWSAGRANA